jgi:hypothetical protein
MWRNRLVVFSEQAGGLEEWWVVRLGGVESEAVMVGRMEYRYLPPVGGWLRTRGRERGKAKKAVRCRILDEGRGRP